MSIKLLTLVSLPLAAAVTFLAPTLITLLGGEEFLPHGYIALQIIIWSIPVGWLNSVTNYVLISLGQERLQTGAFIAGVTFNLVGNLLLLPYLSYVGAGLTTIASEIILLLIFNYYLEQKMPGVGWWRLLWRPGLVAAGMLAVMAAVQPFNLWLALFLGLWVYPAGLIALRVFGAEEKRILAALIPQKIQARFRLQSWLAG
jgi:O-antigen/teichoic acid export membrane protein